MPHVSILFYGFPAGFWILPNRSFLVVAFCFVLFYFPCTADRVPDWEPRTLLGMVEARSVNVEKPHTDPPWEDQCEWHRMTRMIGLDCAVMCNLINTRTRTRTHAHSSTDVLCRTLIAVSRLHTVEKSLSNSSTVRKGMYNRLRRTGRFFEVPRVVAMLFSFSFTFKA